VLWNKNRTRWVYLHVDFCLGRRRRHLVLCVPLHRTHKKALNSDLVTREANRPSVAIPKYSGFLNAESFGTILVRRFYTDTMKQNISESPVYTNGHFYVEPCVTCFVPGYLIVTPQFPAASLSELESNALASLGSTLAAATRAIEVVVRPERVYCALFAEETGSVHFHLFPRTVRLLSQYAAAHPADREISGPRLLDWARRTFHHALSSDYTETVQAIFRELNRNI
jgi:diadenosine tetraphosphate (Ap4A) HIT family hydrolase